MLESRHLKFSFKKVLIVAACRKFVEIGRALSVRKNDTFSKIRTTCAPNSELVFILFGNSKSASVPHQFRIFSRRLTSATSQPFPTTSESQPELHVSQIELYAPRARSELTNYAGRAEPD